jgi:hypothetical protein
MANKNAGKNGVATQFRGNSAVNAQKKAAEKQRSNGRLRRAAEQIVTEEVAAQIIQAFVEKAQAGDNSAGVFLRDLLGEKPKEQIEQTINEIAFRVEGVSPEEADEIFG